MKRRGHPAALLTGTLALGLGLAHAGPPSGATAALKPPVSWEGAVPLAVARPNDVCKAVRRGEWARITCSPKGFIMDAFVLGGSHLGVAFREAKAEHGVHVIFPMKPGDRREMVITRQIGHGGYTIEEGAAVVVSETWLAGETEPTIVIASDP